MNKLNINYKRTNTTDSIDKLVAYISDDTYVSGLDVQDYTDFTRLERDYPYNPYLNTFRELINKGIAIEMIPLKYKVDDSYDWNRSYYDAGLTTIEYSSSTYQYTGNSVVISSRTYYELVKLSGSSSYDTLYSDQLPENAGTSGNLYVRSGRLFTRIGSPTSVIISENILFYSKQRNIPINILASKFGVDWKLVITSRNYEEEIYVTTDKDRSTDELVYYEDIKDYSEIVFFNEDYIGSDGTVEMVFGRGSIEFTTHEDQITKTYANVLTPFYETMEDYNEGEYYPDFILIGSTIADSVKLYGTTEDKWILEKVLNDQFSQAMILSDTSSMNKLFFKDNRIIYLIGDNLYYKNKELATWYEYIDMILNLGLYQASISGIRYEGYSSYKEYDKIVTYPSNSKVTYEECSYHSRSTVNPTTPISGFNPDQWYKEGTVSGGYSEHEILNGINYDTNGDYYIKGIQEAEGQGSYYIIRFYASRFSRLLMRSASYLKGCTQYTSNKFISECIAQMLAYGNVSSIEVVSTELKDNNLKMEFNMYINYLTNRKINVKLNINSI